MWLWKSWQLKQFERYNQVYVKETCSCVPIRVPTFKAQTKYAIFIWNKNFASFDGQSLTLFDLETIGLFDHEADCSKSRSYSARLGPRLFNFLFDLIWPSVEKSAHLIGMRSVHKMVYHTFGMSFITSSICKYLKRLKILIWTLLNPPSCLTSSLKPLSSDLITF